MSPQIQVHLEAAVGSSIVECIAPHFTQVWGQGTPRTAQSSGCHSGGLHTPHVSTSHAGRQPAPSSGRPSHSSPGHVALIHSVRGCQRAAAELGSALATHSAIREAEAAQAPHAGNNRRASLRLCFAKQHLVYTLTLPHQGAVGGLTRLKCGVEYEPGGPLWRADFWISTNHTGYLMDALLCYSLVRKVATSLLQMGTLRHSKPGWYAKGHQQEGGEVEVACPSAPCGWGSGPPSAGVCLSSASLFMAAMQI